MAEDLVFIIVKNMLALLFADKNKIEEIELQMLRNFITELGFKNEKRDEIIKKAFNSLREKGIKLEVYNNLEDNYLILSSMIASAHFNNNLTERKKNVIISFCEQIGIDKNKVYNFLSSNQMLDFSNGIFFMVENIKKLLQNYKSPDIHNTKKSEISYYVATQISEEGLDEIQALYIASILGLNSALSGPPGVGKTRSVMEVAELLNKKIYTKTCSSKTTESHIISHPALEERNGVTVTTHENGPLCLAMLNGGIFYGDEFNLLKEDVQKRMNSAFDERRFIDRSDGFQVQAAPGFLAIISYNPSRNIGSRDLEDSVADRFVHFHYAQWPADLKAYISLTESARKFNRKKYDYKDFNISLELRGISRNGIFLIRDSDGWLDFFTLERLNIEPEFKYYAYKDKTQKNILDPENRKIISSLSAESFNEIELSRMLSFFTEIVNELATTGRSPILDKLGLDNINKQEEMELLTVHKTSTRIQVAAMLHYQYLCSKGWPKYLAQSYATNIIINQITYGSYRNMKVANIDNYTLMKNIAKALCLIAGATKFNTKLIKESIL